MRGTANITRSSLHGADTWRLRDSRDIACLLCSDVSPRIQALASRRLQVQFYGLSLEGPELH